MRICIQDFRTDFLPLTSMRHCRNPKQDLPKLVVVLQSWSKREFIADPSTAQHCIDIFEVNLVQVLCSCSPCLTRWTRSDPYEADAPHKQGEMLVAFREGSHGWYFGRVVHEQVTSPEGLRVRVYSALILPCLQETQEEGFLLRVTARF